MLALTILRCLAGARAAMTLCPVCHRISRQVLLREYTPNSTALLFRSYTCPVCHTEFTQCQPVLNDNFTELYAKYLTDAEAYNREAMNNYRNQTEETKHTIENSKSAEVSNSLPHEENAKLENNNNQIQKVDDALTRKIEYWKRELLDTGKRNRMINYKESKRQTLRIIEPEATTLFNKLAFSEKPLSFQKPINKDSDFRTYSIISLMETLSYTLNVQIGDIKAGATIVEREKTLRNMRSKAKLAQEEQGTNILYLCFGFIYWKSSDRASAQWLKAPLLLMPVSLGIKSLNSPFTLSKTDDEIVVNPTLDYLFRTEYNICMPAFEQKNRHSFDEFILQIENIVDRRGWRVTREVSLGLLSFLKISMYHDIVNHQDKIFHHPVLRAMAGDHKAIKDLPEKADDFDFDSVKPGEWHEVVDSDSSQEEAILLSKLGVSFVMQGPPGTGKSQTITNIIAEALGDGKKVLFVSEKAAALQVVLKRLTEVELSDFCLSLHNYKANKKEIIDNIGANLHLEAETVSRSATNELMELFRDRSFLNKYAQELHQVLKPLNISLYAAFGRFSSLSDATSIDFELENIKEISDEQYSTIMYCLDAFEKALHQLNGNFTDNPWYKTVILSAGQAFQNQFLHDTDGLSMKLRRIADISSSLSKEIGFSFDGSYSSAESILNISRLLQSRPQNLSQDWFLPNTITKGRHALFEAQQQSRLYHQSLDNILANWNESVLLLPIDDLSAFISKYHWIYFERYSDNPEIGIIAERVSAEEIKELINSLVKNSQVASDLLSFNQNLSFDDLERLSEILQIINDSRSFETVWFDYRNYHYYLKTAQQAEQKQKVISDLSEQIEINWESSVFEIDTQEFLMRFKSLYTPDFQRLKSTYENDLSVLRFFQKTSNGVFDHLSIIALLQKVITYRKLLNWFESNNELLSNALGILYIGKNTDWEKIKDSFELAQIITHENKMLRNAVKHGKNLQSIEEELLKEWESAILEIDVESILRRFKIEYTENFYSTLNLYENDINTLQAQMKSDSTNLDNAYLINVLETVYTIKHEEKEIIANEELLSCLFSDDYRGRETDWQRILSLLKSANEICKSINILKEAIIRGTNLKELEKQLYVDWEHSVIEIDTASILNRFKTEYVGVFHKMKSSYKTDINTLRSHAKNIGIKIDDGMAVDLLQIVRSVQDERNWFKEHNDELSILLGDDYYGLNTDWNIIAEILDIAEKRVKENNQIKKIINQSVTVRDLKKQLLVNWKESILEIDITDILNRLQNEYSVLFYKTKESYLADINTFCIYSKAIGKKIEKTIAIKALQNIRTIQIEKKWFDTHYKQLTETLGNIYKGTETDWELVLNEIASSETMIQNRATIAEALEINKRASIILFEIQNEWEPSAVEIDAENMLVRFKSEYTEEFCATYNLFEKDVKAFQMFSKHGMEIIDTTYLVNLLQDILVINQAQQWLNVNHSILASISGTEKINHVDWQDIIAGIKNAKRILDLVPYHTLSPNSVSAIVSVHDDYKLLKQISELSKILSISLIRQTEKKIRGKAYIGDGYSLTSVLSETESFLEDCCSQTDILTELKAKKNNHVVTSKDLKLLVENNTVLCNTKNWFVNHSDEYTKLFCNWYQGVDSDWESIEEGYSFTVLTNNYFGGYTPKHIVQFACNAPLGNILFDASVSELSEVLELTKPKLQSFIRFFEKERFTSKGILDIAHSYDMCANGFQVLTHWIDYTETRAECDKFGLSDFTAKIAQRDNTISDVKSAFEKGFYSKWIKENLKDYASVGLFRRRIHDQYSERFSKLDKKQYDIAKKKIRSSIIKTFPDLDRVSKAGSEIGILQHEMNKKRMIMPIRKLFKSIPNLLLQLKPCLMMSPLSVAYFLEADSYKFDMVIFDEASQVFPQDAIGAILRANQVIIAGDTKQLPPTNFFSSSTSNSSDSYDNDEEDEEVYDSILEETASILPNRTLRWHYRSRHEHLIAFSNQEIYKNELVTFPSSNEGGTDTGVEFVFVEDGYYEPRPKNYNIAEAKKCVELVKAHIDYHPERSLGIIAFNEKQQQAILLELARFREKNPSYEAFFTEDKEDEFFVKNLENVQGDERDTIIFSIAFAKTKVQKSENRPMSMNFGPLNRQGGERRLNVAITRAKINIKLVSSILPSDIDLSRTEAEGVKMLRSYIEFAMNGDASLASAHRSAQTDEFVNTITRFIREHGFIVQQYVGCSGYKIDIAIRHPSEIVSQFVAGIECDGLSYVSARTARDRDRLRSSVLKNMGWNLYRIWSAEWYKNPMVEGQNLISFINNAIHSYDKQIKELEEQKRREEEQKRKAAEKAKAEREAEERRKRQEDERKAEIAKREAEERRKRQEAERKRKSEQEQARKRAEEEKLAKSRQSKSTPITDSDNSSLSWVKYGAVVRHKNFGKGMVLSVSSNQVVIRFGYNNIRTFTYPESFNKGIIVRFESESSKKVSTEAQSKIGAKVYSKYFGYGTIKSFHKDQVVVVFNDGEKTFVYPNAFRTGHLKMAEENK